MGAKALILTASSCCVSGRTLVRTPTGTKEAGALVVGDPVWSLDVASSIQTEGKIVVIRRSRRECVRLCWVDGELVCTPDHPIYSPESGSYLAASVWFDRAVSMLLVWDQEAVVVKPVTSVEILSEIDEVIDLTVDTKEANFIAGGVIVHNKSQDTSINAFMDGPEFTLASDESPRTFRVRACIDGKDPEGSEIQVRANAAVVMAPAGVEPMRLGATVQFGAQPGMSFPAVDIPGELLVSDENYPYQGEWMESYGRNCQDGIIVVFERSDGLPEGSASVEWSIGVDASPPPGSSQDSPFTLAISEE